MPHSKTEPTLEEGDRIKHQLNSLVEGRVLSSSVVEFYRKALVLILKEQNKARPDNTLLEFLCDSVRLGREYMDHVKRQQEYAVRKLARGH